MELGALVTLLFVIVFFVAWPLWERRARRGREMSAYDKLMSVKGTGPFAHPESHSEPSREDA